MGDIILHLGDDAGRGIFVLRLRKKEQEEGRKWYEIGGAKKGRAGRKKPHEGKEKWQEKEGGGRGGGHHYADSAHTHFSFRTTNASFCCSQQPTPDNVVMT